MQEIFRYEICKITHYGVSCVYMGKVVKATLHEQPFTITIPLLY